MTMYVRTCVHVHVYLCIWVVASVWDPHDPVSDTWGGNTVCVNVYANVHFVSMFVRACVYVHELL